MIASKTRLMLLGVLAVFVVGAAASSSALALPTAGPFWQVGGTKLTVGVSKAITDKNVAGTTASLYSKLGNTTIKITCKKVTSSGFISNGTQHGESQENIEFSEGCTFSALNANQEFEVQSKCKVTEPIKVTQANDSLWYRVTNGGVKTAEQQVLFVPKPGNNFTTITVTGTGCLFTITNAAVKGSVAARVAPENTEVKIGKLIAPSEQQKKVWQPLNQPEETEAALTFNGEPARFEAEAEVELTSKEAFGIIE